MRSITPGASGASGRGDVGKLRESVAARNMDVLLRREWSGTGLIAGAAVRVHAWRPGRSNRPLWIFQGSRRDSVGDGPKNFREPGGTRRARTGPVSPIDRPEEVGYRPAPLGRGPRQGCASAT